MPPSLLFYLRFVIPIESVLSDQKIFKEKDYFRVSRENEGQRGRVGALAGVCEFH